MLISWTFSWSELIFDYFIGVVAGWFLFTGTEPNPHAATLVLLRFLARTTSARTLVGTPIAFREWFSKPENFFWAMAWNSRRGDCLVRRVGSSFRLSGRQIFAWALLFFLCSVSCKSQLRLVHQRSGISDLARGSGLGARYSNNEDRKKPGETMGKAGFAGGVFFDEFDPGTGDPPATTLGCTVHTWSCDTPFKHELYHTRQYIFMGDWFIPFWCVGLLWGIISAAIAKGEDVSYLHTVGAHKTKEIGNPLEVAAYHM